jgi:hypothetical protein
LIENKGKEIKPAMVQVFGVQGNLLQNLESGLNNSFNGAKVYDMSHLAPGLYFIQITQNEEKSTFRWIKTNN